MPRDAFTMSAAEVAREFGYDPRHFRKMWRSWDEFRVVAHRMPSGFYRWRPADIERIKKATRLHSGDPLPEVFGEESAVARIARKLREIDEIVEAEADAALEVSHRSKRAGVA